MGEHRMAILYSDGSMNVVEAGRSAACKPKMALLGGVAPIVGAAHA